MIVGSCRGKEDEERKKSMEDLTKHLSLENTVEIKANIPYSELIENYQKASIGLHTMWNEHFGISVVELMAAGLITVAHRFGFCLSKCYRFDVSKENKVNLFFYLQQIRGTVDGYN